MAARSLDAFSSSLFSKFQNFSGRPRTTIFLPRTHATQVSAVIRVEEEADRDQALRSGRERTTLLSHSQQVGGTPNSYSRKQITHRDRKSSTPSPAPAASRPKAAQLSLPVIVCNAFDDIINNFVDPPLRPSVDPKNVLTDNFAPVEELPPTECPEVEGELPPSLDGVYIRNGPNPRYLPRGPYHLFDGDGMLHALRISGGRASLCSRYVRTYRFSVEDKAGSPVYPNFFSGFYGYGGVARGAVSLARVLTGQFNLAQGVGLANTSLVFFGNRLYALGESDLPYEVAVMPNGEIRTVGRQDFEGKLSMGMTAHPKVDPETGEVFAFRYGPVPPYLTYFRFDASGRKQPDVPIFSLPQPSMFHDFAITKRYALFSDIQIVMNPLEMIFGGGSPVGADPRKVPRVGVMPRYAKDESEMRWFEVPGFNCMHAINAWEEEGGESLVLVAPNMVSVEHTLDRMELLHCSVEKLEMDLREGIVRRTPLAVESLEYGVINPWYRGKKSRYAYVAPGDPLPKVSGVVKLDLEAPRGGDCTVARRSYGPRCSGGEPFFVPRHDSASATGAADEDDGYVVSYVHDDNKGHSKFLVMDAKSPMLEIVASVTLPARVPHGFHGLFVSESDLQTQRQWREVA